MFVTPNRLKSFKTRFAKGRADECWLWQGAVFKGSGYGQLGFGGYAHRFAWILHHGHVPSGLHVLHHCDNRLCVNPNHLFLGTNQDNIKDMVSKGRQKPGGVGEQATNVLLTEAEVREIKRRQRPYRPGRWGNWSQLAREFKVSRGCIREICLGNNWKHTVTES